MPNVFFNERITSLHAFRSAETRGERLRRLFAAHYELTTQYGPKYREINALLEQARTLSDDPDNPQNPTPEAKAEIIKAVGDVRTQVVLFFQTFTQRVEFAINELVPDTFPVPDNPSVQSFDDEDALYAIGGGICALGGAIALLPGGQIVGAGVIGFGAGFTIGVAIGDLLD